jgi:pyruvate kinase
MNGGTLMRRAKIVCTIGPASCDEATLRGLVEAGMNVARMNFSHGTREEHRDMYRRIREISHDVAIMQDLKGPKIRVGAIGGDGVRLVDGGSFTLTTREGESGPGVVSVSYSDFAKDISKGDNIFLADGTIHLEAEKISGDDVVCRVLHGGLLTSGKGVNIPGVRISEPALTAKDEVDLEYGLELGVDMVALSFVTGPEDVGELKERIRKKGSSAWVVAKIEKREALEQLDGIVKIADALMIARGDLGVEIAAEEVPIVQKSIIQECRRSATPVITATQMLESMVHEEIPTRAEASDVANAIIDGTDAVMLSAETAAGAHPIEAVRVMSRIAERAEEYRAENPSYWEREELEGEDHLVDAVSLGAVEIAEEIGASAIACLTHSGRTARMIARYRPLVPVVALTDNPLLERTLNLVWGVDCLGIDRIEETERVIAVVRERLGAVGYVGSVVLTAGVPTKERGSTNTVNVMTV